MVAFDAVALIARLQSDPVFFVEQLWDDRGLNEKAPLGDVERDMVRFFFDRSNPMRGVLGWRSIGKTHFLTGALTCHRLLIDPDTKILIVSKSGGEAKKTIRLIRGWIRNTWFLQHLDPSLGPGIDAANEFQVAGSSDPDARTPSVSAVGIDGQLPSKRAHLIIPDDVETKGNTLTITARTTLRETVTEFRAIASYGDQEVAYVGTPHHEQSLYTALAKDKSYVFRSYPKLYPAANEHCLGLAPMLQDRLDRGLAKPGDITCPHRVTAEDIVKDRAEGRTYFAMQCMLLTDLGDTLKYPLRLGDLIVFPVDSRMAPSSLAWGTANNSGSTAYQDHELPSYGLGEDRLHRPIFISPEWQPYTRRVMYVDPAGGGADKTGYGIVLFLNGLFHTPGGTPDTMGAGELTGGATPLNLEFLAKLAHHHRITDIVVESNLSGAREVIDNPYIQLLQIAVNRVAAAKADNWGCNVSGKWSTGQKEHRMLNIAEPIMASHRWVVDPSVIRLHELQRQITRLTRERNSLGHEDMFEALTGALGVCTSGMNIDPEKAQEAARLERLKALTYQFAEPAQEPRFVGNPRG